MQVRYLFLFGALTLWLAACAPMASELVTPSPATTPAHFASPPPRASSTATPAPTETVADAPTATPDIAGTVVAVSPPRIHSSYRSPDQKWLVEVVIHDCANVGDVDVYAYEQLRITHLADGVQQVVAEQLQYCGGLGAAGLGGLFWSPNSHYFYFTDAREGVPDGLACYWDRPMSRVDVTTKQVEHFGAFGPLSPDGSALAMTMGNELIILKLDNDEPIKVPAINPDATVGAATWSPDGQEMVYLQTDSNCHPFGKSYLARLNIADNEQALLLESETPSFQSVVWDAPNRVKLYDEQGKEWRFSLTTNTLTSAP